MSAACNAGLPELHGVIQRLSPPKVEVEPLEIRRPGRPQTRTLDYYRELLREYSVISEWFAGKYGRTAKSDVELVEAYACTFFLHQGLRESRAFSSEIKSKTKTLRNEWSRARRLLDLHP